MRTVEDIRSLLPVVATSSKNEEAPVVAAVTAPDSRAIAEAAATKDPNYISPEVIFVRDTLDEISLRRFNDGDFNALLGNKPKAFRTSNAAKSVAEKFANSDGAEALSEQLGIELSGTFAEKVAAMAEAQASEGQAKIDAKAQNASEAYERASARVENFKPKFDEVIKILKSLWADSIKSDEDFNRLVLKPLSEGALAALAEEKFLDPVNLVAARQEKKQRKKDRVIQEFLDWNDETVTKFLVKLIELADIENGKYPDTATAEQKYQTSSKVNAFVSQYESSLLD